MRKSTLKIVIVESLIIVLFLINSYFFKYNNLYIITVILGLILFFVYKLLGFEKDNFRFKKDILLIMINYALVFLLIYYISGLYFGYLKTGYSLKLISIIKNIFPYICVVIVTELLRYVINAKISSSKIGLVLSVVIFTLLEVTLNIHLYNINKVSGFIQMLGNVIVPGLFKNALLTYVALKVGYKINIIYRLIMELPIFIIPIMPDVSTYLYLLSSILLNWLLLMNLIKFFVKKKISDPRDMKSYKVLIIISIILILVCIYFSSGLFKYSIMAIGSNSMKDTFSRGDAIIFEKAKPKDLKVGQILVFNKENKKVVHRIVKITNIKEQTYIITKGDANNFKDDWVVTKEEVIGIVKFPIKYIGFPTIHISELLG